MIRVAIVEDDELCLQKITEYLGRYGRESGEEMETVIFRDGQDLVEGYRQEYDIIFMDVIMPFMDGMTAAEKVRGWDEDVVIIFVTNAAQYAVRGYAVNALDYLLKPIAYFAFSQTLERALNRRKKKEKQYLAVRVKGGVRKIPLEEIHYVESQGHVLLLHTVSGDMEIGGTMKSLEERLAEFYFCRCNKGYLLNLAHVDGVRGNMAMIAGNALIISRPRKKDFMQQLTCYMGEELL